MESKEIEWIHYIRKEELLNVINNFPTPENSKILELGGGDGFLAKVISEKGYNIISLDINPRHPLEFPVKKIDGKNIPFTSDTFDLIFTSQVIAHVEDLNAFFNEIKRVLKKNGVIIHIVPSSYWVVITNFWHYVLLPKKMINIFRRLDEQSKNHHTKVEIQKKSRNFKIVNNLFLHPLGTSPSFLHEIFYFSKRQWLKLFEKNGFSIIRIEKTHLLYSGHGIFRMKFIKIRKLASRLFFSSCYIFVMKKSTERSQIQ